MARYMGGPIRAQKHDDFCDLLWLAAKRNDRQHHRFNTGLRRPYPIGQGCVDEPGRHGVHSNSLGGKLQRCGLSETRYTVFACDIADLTGTTNQAKHGTIIHDGSPAAFQQLRNFVLHAKPNTRQVGRHYAVPIFLARFENTPCRSYEAGIVEGIVQATVLTDCAFDHVLHFGRVAHIDANAAGFTTVVSDRRDSLFSSCAIDISYHHARAMSRESDGSCAPDAGGTASYHDDFPRHEIRHLKIPFR